MRKILSYNVNGIRSATKKGLLDWLKQVDPDIICFQEMKAHTADLDQTLQQPEGYHAHWHAAEKKGYSGVGIWSKEAPKHVEVGCGIPIYDREGRVLRADFDGYSVISLYLPSGTSGEERQTVKEEFMRDFTAYVRELLKEIPKLVIAGDYNICHQAIDIHDPVGNKKSSGFLPHEREWLSEFMGLGMVDSFRRFNQEPHQYTWWSQRAASRERNKGWRIDYQLVSQALVEKCTAHVIYPFAVHSDHAAIELTLDL
jgi:exodeoxyribonuclease III